MVSESQRPGVLVTPHRRLTPGQIKLVDGVSRDLLEDPGLLCHNAAAADIFRSAGARVEDADGCARIRIGSALIDRAVNSAPATVVLGARDPSHRLLLDAHEPRVRFGTGAETNIWLDVQFDGTVPKFTRQPGSVARLRDSAHLCDNLKHLDFFIRNVNIQDDEVTPANKDVNKFFASLDNISKHVQAGLTDLGALDDVLRMGEMIAGGPDAFEQSPMLSFITCVIKSPLQMVDDTTTTMIEIAQRRAPVVISSCPMGGATSPFGEFGMVAQVNAEVLAGITLNQLVSPGAPVLYGACPVRTRLDNLNDMYGVGEFVHYNQDCTQMARHYGIPCYSEAGVGDASVPGIQATAEKMLTLAAVPQAGPQYLHYAFGLLERTNVYCPEQAILDDAHIGLIKHTLADPKIDGEGKEHVLALVREVMQSSQKTFMYNIPLPSKNSVYVRYPLEDSEGGALAAAHCKYRQILERPRNSIPADLRRDIVGRFPGLLPANTNLQETVS